MGSACTYSISPKMSHPPPPPPDSLVDDIHDFVKRQQQPGSIVNQVITAGLATKEELQEQFETFPAAIEKMRKGEMSYSEMRALYG